MPVEALTLRQEKGSSLTVAEMDNNLRKLRDAIDANEQLTGVSLNTDGTLKDGAVSSTAKIADGVVTRAKLAADAKVPSGMIMSWPNTGALPSGWLECNGAAVSRTTYADLFAAIGTTWGAGDGSTTFNLPDLQRRTLVGAGGSGTADLGNAVGNTGGVEGVTLTQGHLPASMSLSTVTNNWNNGAPTGGSTRILSDVEYTDGQYTATQTYTNAGGGVSHNNIQPSAVIRWVVKT